ncbi:endonuclease/exonuclease/phosphatase family protein [Micromonospora sp. NPDC005806]|uniref:endonuclease/exonuclease/phosphatase family protein n=1 Tax=Micromonospora sp. NPDC005806 TaxID=3364234 RepID=UPI0036A2FBCE
MANDLIVMTWNVENLFRPDDTDPSAAETYAAKLSYLAGLISGTGANVVALQEIGSSAAAEDLRAALGEPWQAVVSAHPDGRGIRVALLARHALTEKAQIIALPQAGLPAVPGVDGDTLTHLGRGAVQVHVDCGGPGLRLLTAHGSPQEQTAQPRRTTLSAQRGRARLRRRLRPAAPYRRSRRRARTPQ